MLWSYVHIHVVSSTSVLQEMFSGLSVLHVPRVWACKPLVLTAPAVSKHSLISGFMGTGDTVKSADCLLLLFGLKLLCHLSVWLHNNINQYCRGDYYSKKIKRGVKMDDLAVLYFFTILQSHYFSLIPAYGAGILIVNSWSYDKVCMEDLHIC